MGRMPVTVNTYAHEKIVVCIDCYDLDTARFDTGSPNAWLALDTVWETGDLVPSQFGRTECGVCGNREPGHRFPATLLTLTDSTTN